MKVLFIGNSFTARNDLPGLIARMAESRGARLEHELVSAGGASLRAHWNRGDAVAAMRRMRPDRVVLQEQSTLPVKNPRRMHENIRLFVPGIEASGAKPVLYITWARQNAPDAQAAITRAYTAVARELDCTVAPVGIAWETFLRTHDHPALHDRDGSHPTPAGSYLAACVFFTVLFGKSPLGLPPPAGGVTAGEARAIQQAARAATGRVR